MAEFVTIAVFRLPHEYAVVKARLESEGIPCFAKDERTVLYTNVNGGIKLQVPDTDVEQAMDILTDAGIETVDGVDSLYAREPWLEVLRRRTDRPMTMRDVVLIALGLIALALLVHRAST
jgi:hypothetical protein